METQKVFIDLCNQAKSFYQVFRFKKICPLIVHGGIILTFLFIHKQICFVACANVVFKFYKTSLNI